MSDPSNADPTDAEAGGIGAKACFLGPKSENESWVRAELQGVLDHWFDWRKALFTQDPPAISVEDELSTPFLRQRAKVSRAVRELSSLLTAESPTYSPRYIGHMVSETALPALLGHFAALLHNPNNTSREVSRVGSALEIEAIAMLADMIGYDPKLACGHFTSGGTVANIESAWRARFRMDTWLALALHLAETRGVPLDVPAAAHMGWARYRALIEAHGVSEPEARAASAVVGNPFDIAERIGRLTGQPYRGPVMLASGAKHYSWIKAANLLGLGEEAFWNVTLDAEGRLSVAALRDAIERAHAAGRPVLMVVSVAGTTEAGEIDPVDEVEALLASLKSERDLHIWSHVDAAYGGFFCTLSPDDDALALKHRSALQSIPHAESVTLDPHKLGYVPYACGALLTRDAESNAVSSFAAPYIDRPDLGHGPWSSTLEGSRSAAGAAATWLMGKAFGFEPQGFGRVVRATIEARRHVQAAVAAGVPQARMLTPADTNVLCFSLAEPGEALSRSNARTAAVHECFVESPDFSLSKTVLGDPSRAQIAAHVAAYDGEVDTNTLVLLRCVFMNPFWSDPKVRDGLTPELVAALNTFVARSQSG